MIYAFLGVLMGVVLGFLVPITYPPGYSLYISVAILAALDSVFGAFRATLEEKFDIEIFVSGFFGNTILAVALAYLGDKLGVPLYYAAIFAFGGRLFQNLAVVRRIAIHRLREARGVSKSIRNQRR